MRSDMLEHPADRLISIETQQQILDLLSPEEFAVVCLRFDGLNQASIAMLLGLARSTVSMRFTSARRKILDRFPELTAWAEDRNHSRGSYHLISRSWGP